jgi:hypothetical protein
MTGIALVVFASRGAARNVGFWARTRTSLAGLTMSVDRGRPEVAGLAVQRLSESKAYNWCGNQSIFLSEGVNLTASVTVALGMAV